MRLAFFPLLFDDFIVKRIDAPERLRTYLMKNEYGRWDLRRFVLVAVFIFDDCGRCDGHIVVERVGEEVLLCGRFLVWIAEEVLECERTESEEVGIDGLEVALSWR